MKSHGYSLIEMMVTVAIIGILATLGVTNYEETVRLLKAKTSIAVMLKASHSVVAARHGSENPEYMLDITGSTCTGCNGTAVQIQSWNRLSFNGIPRDAWGSPLVMDENNGEFGAGDCRYDSFWSAGPDTIFAGLGGGDDVAGDDLIVRVPRLLPLPGCAQKPMVEYGPNF